MFLTFLSGSILTRVDSVDMAVDQSCARSFSTSWQCDQENRLAGLSSPTIGQRGGLYLQQFAVIILTFLGRVSEFSVGIFCSFMKE